MGGDLAFDTLDELHDEMGTALARTEGSTPRGGDEAAFTRVDVPDGSLTLFTYPLLVDEGRLSERADELKLALEDAAFVEVHPEDAATAGLTDGGRAIVKTERGEAELPVRATEHIARGSVFVPFNNPGLRANTLLSGSFQTFATLEPVDVPGDEQADEPGDASAVEPRDQPRDQEVSA
jgi:predicted molibdopterin-dependent oxidoreductase YjgC